MERHYFMGANSCRGFEWVWDGILDGLDKVLVLSGGPGTGKSSLMKKLGRIGQDRGLWAEYWHCASDPDSLDGVYFPTLSVAVVDGTAPHVRPVNRPGVWEFALDLSAGWDWSGLWQSRQQVMALYEENRAAYREAYRALASAWGYLDKRMRCISTCMEAGEGEAFVREMLKATVEQLPKKEGQGRQFLAYATAVTPRGFVSSYQSITKGIGTVIALGGEACREKDALLTAVDKKARARGYDTRVYRCGLQGRRPDAVVIPGGDVAFVDSGDLHRWRGTGAMEVDFDLLLHPGRLNERKAELERLKKAARRELKAGVLALKKAKDVHDELETAYLETADFSHHDLYLQRAEALLFE